MMVTRILRLAQPFPVHRVLRMLTHELREHRFSSSTPDQHIVKRGNDIKHRTWLELSCEPFGL